MTRILLEPVSAPSTMMLSFIDKLKKRGDKRQPCLVPHGGKARTRLGPYKGMHASSAFRSFIILPPRQGVLYFG